MAAEQEGEPRYARSAMTTERTRGYFSLLRWRPDPFRDESKNVAVVLVDELGRFGGLRAAPLSSVSKQLHDQGILDSIVAGISERFTETAKPTLGILTEWRAGLTDSLTFTEPRSAAVSSPEETLDSLYKAYVRPQSAPRDRLAKGPVLDRLVDRLRRSHLPVHRGQYVSDFLFDAVVDAQTPKVLSVLSFANRAKLMKSTEHDAAHFLFACNRIDVEPRVLVQPPTDISSDGARESYQRVMGWIADSKVPTFDAADLAVLEDVLAT